jgi:hypothetical protein
VALGFGGSVMSEARTTTLFQQVISRNGAVTQFATQGASLRRAFLPKQLISLVAEVRYTALPTMCDAVFCYWRRAA